MELTSGMLLSVEGLEYPTTLALILRRPDNSLVGLTSAWPFIGDGTHKLVSLQDSSDLVGLSDVIRWPDAGGENEDVVQCSSGILTVTIPLPDWVKPSEASLVDRSTMIRDTMGCTGYIGGSPVGSVGHWVDDMRLEARGLMAFPLLRLERTEEDQANPAQAVRNGALVTDEKGAAIGVVVNMFDDGKFYSIVPIEHVLRYHDLEFPAFARGPVTF